MKQAKKTIGSEDCVQGINKVLATFSEIGRYARGLACDERNGFVEISRSKYGSPIYRLTAAGKEIIRGFDRSRDKSKLYEVNPGEGWVTGIAKHLAESRRLSFTATGTEILDLLSSCRCQDLLEASNVQMIMTPRLSLAKGYDDMLREFRDHAGSELGRDHVEGAAA